MPFLFTCPHCGARTQIPESFVGQSGPCHSCGKTVQIDPPTRGGRADAEPPPPSNESVGITIAIVLGFVSVVIAGIGVTLIVATPTLQTQSSARKLSTAKANMNLIVSAMHTYHSEHGVFPPPYIVDESGKKMHSWRVLLLPYLGPEATNVYRNYRMDEPWNSPHNLQAASYMPDVYRSPADPDAKGSNTANYFVIVGPQTMFPGDGRQSTYQGNLDPLNHTILVVESVSRNTIWTEPEEFEVATMQFELNTFSGGDMSGQIIGGIALDSLDAMSGIIAEAQADAQFRVDLAASGATLQSRTVFRTI